MNMRIKNWHIGMMCQFFSVKNFLNLMYILILTYLSSGDAWFWYEIYVIICS